MEGGNFRSRRAFARSVGVSHARVSQVLGLLRLNPRAWREIEALGDPFSSRIVTERKFRPIAMLPEKAQESRLKKMLAASQ